MSGTLTNIMSVCDQFKPGGGEGGPNWCINCEGSKEHHDVRVELMHLRSAIKTVRERVQELEAEGEADKLRLAAMQDSIDKCAERVSELSGKVRRAHELQALTQDNQVRALERAEAAEAKLQTAEQEREKLEKEHEAEQVLLAAMAGESVLLARGYSVPALAHLIAERAAKAERELSTLLVSRDRFVEQWKRCADEQERVAFNRDNPDSAQWKAVGRAEVYRANADLVASLGSRT